MYNMLHSQIKAFANTTEGEFQGFVGYSADHNAAIVAIRGTSNFVTWFVNINKTSAEVPYPKCDGCTVNGELYNIYLEMSAFVKAQVQFILSKYRNAAIYVTGHGVGGALAALAAVDIKTTFGRVDLFYSYGQPRLGNRNFALYSQSIMLIYRVIHYADIGPQVPHLTTPEYMHGGE
jgi:predicted lipase